MSERVSPAARCECMSAQHHQLQDTGPSSDRTCPAQDSNAQKPRTESRTKQRKRRGHAHTKAAYVLRAARVAYLSYSQLCGGVGYHCHPYWPSTHGSAPDAFPSAGKGKKRPNSHSHLSRNAVLNKLSKPASAISPCSASPSLCAMRCWSFARGPRANLEIRINRN